MGCDIHFYVETKQADGTWAAYGNFEEDDGYIYQEDELYNGRNYDLFSILADVRNGYGFAGVDTGDGFTPIAQPKGVPDDASAIIKTIADNWACDGHSHSYFTLAELQAFDWEGQVTKKRGYVNKLHYVEWRKSGETYPDMWCGGIGCEYLTQDKAEKMSDDEILAGDVSMVHCEWAVTYKDSAGGFINETMPAMATLSDNPENVRCVFFFDN